MTTTDLSRSIDALRMESAFEYSNSFGAIFRDFTIIQGFRNMLPVRYTDINKVLIVKERKLRWNYIFAAITAVLLAVVAATGHSAITKYTLLITSCIMLVNVFLIREYNYKITFWYSNEFFEIRVPKTQVYDAKILITKVNRKIRQSRLK